MGPGLLEHTYEEGMCLEMDKRRVKFVRQVAYPVLYKGQQIGDPVFMAQVLTYLPCTGLRIGLLINFNGRLLRTGIRRFIL
jgi:hypothetical protein